MLHSQTDGTTHRHAGGDAAAQGAQSPESHGIETGTTSGAHQVSMDTLPNDKSDTTSKPIEEHTSGHIGKQKEMGS